VAPTRLDLPELMEAPGQDAALLAGSLADLRRVNRWFGGCWLTLRGLRRLTTGLPAGTPLTILDVATGSADIPAAAVAWARRRGWPARVVATDRSPAILAVAARRQSGVLFAAADAGRLPFADGAVDIAMCSLVLHHLPPDPAVAMLSELRRVSRRGLIVNDLLRHPTGFLGAWLFSRLLTRNPLTRHDALVSVRRAYTQAEMIALAARAGLGPVAFDWLPGYRVAMTAGGGT
jgi:SAM-dependent methyltransferase